MPRIVYLSWPAAEIAGGIKAAFQHVQMLNEAGLEAVVASEDAALPFWFETRATLVGFDAIGAQDVLVFPENNARFLKSFQGSPNPKVVFCQNPHLVAQGMAEGWSSYADGGVSHIMCPSHNVIHFCRLRFPGLKLGYTPFYIDHNLFAYRSRKAAQITAVPRKRRTEFGAIVDLFRTLYPQLRDIRWLYAHEATEAQVADAMKDSAVFLSLARLEAHGMTTLEAMACGCIVAGFTGVVGGTDSATARNGFWAAEDDIQACVHQLARAVQLAVDGGPVYELMVAEGRRTAWEYRREESARLLLEFWRGALPELARHGA